MKISGQYKDVFTLFRGSWKVKVFKWKKVFAEFKV